MNDLSRKEESISPRLSEKAPAWRNAAYAAGDVGFNIYWTVVETFLLFFYTDVYRLPPAVFTTAILLARAIDLIAGPVLGILADRTYTRFGRYRPYLFFGVPLGSAFFLMFCAPSTWPHPLQSGDTWITSAAATVIAYLFFALFYAAANIPYTALLAVVTTDPLTKKRLASLRFAAAAGSVLVVQFATLPLVQHLGHGNVAKGWQRVAMLYALAASAALLYCFAGTREIVLPSLQKMSLGRDLKALAQSRNWYILLATTILALAAFTCRGGITLYYMRYVLNRPGMTSVFLVANSGAALGACLLVSSALKSLITPHALLRYCSAAGAAASLSLLYVPDDHLVMAFIAQTLFGLATGALLPAIFALFADLPFESTPLLGRSINGLIAATSLLALKFGSLVGTAILAASLTRMGYVANQVQTPGVRHAIVLLIAIVPAVLLALCWFSSRLIEIQVRSETV
jgi:glycoside/pentoside/hexuronide:cation symporter, GPH family